MAVHGQEGYEVSRVVALWRGAALEDGGKVELTTPLHSAGAQVHFQRWESSREWVVERGIRGGAQLQVSFAHPCCRN